MWMEPKNGNLHGGTFCCPHKINYKEGVSIILMVKSNLTTSVMRHSHATGEPDSDSRILCLYFPV